MTETVERLDLFRTLFFVSRFGYELPGTNTIPEQIAGNKAPYYKALEAADEAYKAKRIDVSKLENLLEEGLAKQLVEVHQKATGRKLEL